MDIYQFVMPNHQDHVDDAHVLTPKHRKPYTITKQREKWTDDEHNKFVESLKLYGRAWRQIEEFIGTKTAVQIRSHAQKFFSKVVRGGNDTTESLVEAIEIPPPRPKRKPTHPYPRKLVDPQSKIKSIAFQPEKRQCSNILTTNYGNCSPKSVLPAAMPYMSASPDVCLSSSGSADLQSGSFFSINNDGKPVMPAASSFANSAVDISANICIESSDEEVEAPEVTIILFGQIVSTKVYGSSPTRFPSGSHTSANFSAEDITHKMQQDISMVKNNSTLGIPSTLNFTHSSLLGEADITSPKRGYKSGFVPYQRCFVAGNIKSANTLAEEEGRQLVQLCL